MRLMMWHKGGKHENGRGPKGKPNNIDTTSDRLLFYDENGSTTFDTASGVWYKNGQPFIPSYPMSFTLDDGRTVTASSPGQGGRVQWVVN